MEMVKIHIYSQKKNISTLETLELWEYWVEALIAGDRSGQSAWNPIIWPFRLMFFLGFALLWAQGLAELIKCFWYLSGRIEELDSGDG